MSLQFGFPSTKRMTYESAVVYIFMYNQKGSTGWRMPTDAEWVEHAGGIAAWAQDDDKDPDLLGDLWFALPVRDVDEE